MPKQSKLPKQPGLGDVVDGKNKKLSRANVHAPKPTELKFDGEKEVTEEQIRGVTRLWTHSLIQ